MSLNYSDEEIIKLCRGTDLERKNIVAYLYKSLFPLGKSACPRYSKDKEIFGAAYNRSIVTLIQDLLTGKFRGDAAIKTYFRKIMQNNCMNEGKKIAGKNHSNEIPQKGGQSVEEQYIKKESRALIAQLVEDIYDKFGKKCRELYHLDRKFLSKEEIAAKMGFDNIDSVKAARTRCKKKFITYLDSNPVLKQKLKDLL